MPKRYRKAASFAADIYGFDQPGTFFAKSHLHSTASIFHFKKSDAQYLCKIDCSPTAHSYSAMLQRFEYAEFLHKAGIRVLSPLRSPQDKIIECFHLDECDCMLYAWPMIPGTTLTDIAPDDLKEYYQDWAKLIAGIHWIAKDYPKPPSPLEASTQDFLNWHQEWSNALDKLSEPALKAVWQELKAELDSYPASESKFGMIHNDIHPQNMLMSDDGLYLIDFDRATRHFFVQDIANAIYSEYSRIAYHSSHKSRLKSLDELFLKPFINTYLEHYPSLISDLEKIESFILYRRILMYCIFEDELQLYAPKTKKKLADDIILRTPFLKRSIREILKL